MVVTTRISEPVEADLDVLANAVATDLLVAEVLETEEYAEHKRLCDEILAAVA